jgi:spermidine synthase
MAKGFDDSRVNVQICDGLKYLVDNENAFDVIITDSSDPMGPASSLFGASFYKAVSKSLRSGGIMCAQAECLWLHLELIRDMMVSATEFFNSVEYSYTSVPTYPSGQIGFIIGSKDRDSCKSPLRGPSENQLKELRYYTSEIHAASFILPAFARRRLEGVLRNL